MTQQQKVYYEKRGQMLVKNLKSRHFEAYYCETKEGALEKALELIPQGASVGWGGTVTAEEIGLLEAVRSSKTCHAIDRDLAKTAEERVKLMKQAMLADVFITGANALSMDGQMVNIDGTGNRMAPIVWGPDSVIVVAGMNKAADTLEAAITRARTVAAPVNAQRFPVQTPCKATGVCGDCRSESCICNHILVTRNSRPAGRIKFVLVGEDLGF